MRASLDGSIIPEPVDIVVCDASFIGLAKVLEAPLKLAKPGAKLVALIKPQFEAGREEVGKGGVVRDPAVHERVCAEAKAWVELQGWTVLGITPSPITGPEGNVEFLLGADEEWLRPRERRELVEDWRSLPSSLIELLGGAQRLAVESGYGNRLVRRAPEAVASCRPAGRSAWSGRSSTRCWASRWRWSSPSRRRRGGRRR